MKKKILIVGGTGFIGFHLAKECLKKNFQVTSLSFRKPKLSRYLKRVNYLHCDISNKEKLHKKIKKKFDFVVNLGGYVNHKERKKTFDSHYKGCKNLADFFVNRKILSFIQIGSSVEYGSSRSPQSENSIFPLRKLKSTYGIAKLTATNYLLDLFIKKNFPATILRLYLVYGPNQEPNRLISNTINSCLLDKKFPCSKGDQLRDFLFVDDLIRAIISCFENSKSRGEIINIGQGKPKKVKDIIHLIRERVGLGKPEYNKIALREDEIKILYPTIKKAKKILKWEPKISLKKGIDLTINYYKSILVKK